MKRLALVGLAALGLSACSGKLPEGVDESILTQSVGKSIGSPSTCVVIADADGKLVWRGSAEKAIDSSPTPAERSAAISEAVTKILATYPPK